MEQVSKTIIQFGLTTTDFNKELLVPREGWYPLIKLSYTDWRRRLRQRQRELHGQGLQVPERRQHLRKSSEVKSNT
jgi:hypothetical protein